MSFRANILTQVLLAAFAGSVFLSGITWGLPSKWADRYLFGIRPVWTGQEILDRAGGWKDDPARGADVDADPLKRGINATVLNATDADRAAVVLRYRLYSFQPDEMITFRALSRMRPGLGKLDPGLYQYGGLWVYGVGALLKFSSIFQYTTLRRDVAWYIDNPDAFARFYIVARLYSVAWGVAGVFAVFALARRLMAGNVFPIFATGLFPLLPVVMTAAHEAKPHLAGAVLTLFAILAAVRCVEKPTAWRAMIVGILCGLAASAVVSAILSWSLIPALGALLIFRSRRRELAGTGACPPARAGGYEGNRRVSFRLFGLSLSAAVFVYACLNPYVIVHLFSHREVLTSNLSNSTAMYGVTGAGRFATAGLRLTQGGTPVAVVGLCVFAGTILLGIVRRKLDLIVTLCAVPTALVLIQFVALAAGKPGEYARFALVPIVVLTLFAVRALAQFKNQSTPALLGVIAAALTVIFAFPYVAAFRSDAGPDNSRATDAEILSRLDEPRIEVVSEPAPYCMPPVDLWAHELVLVQRDTAKKVDGIRLEMPGTLGVDADDAAPVSWAAKRILIRGRTPNR